MLQAQLSLHAQRVTVLTPMGLMGHAMWNTTESQTFNHRPAKDCFAYTVPEVQFQFRMHDYYMGEFFAFITLNVTYVLSRDVIELGCHHREFQEWPSSENISSQLRQFDPGGSAQD